MDNEKAKIKAVKILTEIISERGGEVLITQADIIPCIGIIMDFFYDRELVKYKNLLIHSFERAKVPQDLVRNKDIVEYRIPVLEKRLIEKYGISEDNAKWTVNAWASAIKLIGNSATNNKPKTKYETNNKPTKKILELKISKIILLYY